MTSDEYVMNRLRPRTSWSPRRTNPHFARVLITDRRWHLESAGRAHTVPLHIYLRSDGRRFPPRERRARTRCTIRGRVFAFDRVGGLHHRYDRAAHLWKFFEAVRSCEPVLQDAVFGH